jgi:transposase-like protein
MRPSTIYCRSCFTLSGTRAKLKLSGHYLRKSDQAKVQRYCCSQCGKSTSDATSSDCFGQKKRHMNGSVLEHLVGGFSQRRAARVLCLNRKTIARKLVCLGQKAQICLLQMQRFYPKLQILEFDDLETSEHTKCKPLSVTLAVAYKTRRIVHFKVSTMPAKGRLAAIARKKYGPRVDGRKQARLELFNEIKDFVAIDAVIKSDQNPHYISDVARVFPEVFHLSFKGRKACVVGQGELKRGGFDPLFSLNHTCAMLRANINRLFRKTWCTTKKAECLVYHIALYALYHNLVLLKDPST